MASHQWSEYFEGMNSISAVLNSRSRSRSFESLVSPVASVASSQVTLCSTSSLSWVDVNGNQMITIFLNYDGNERSIDVKCDDAVSFSVENVYEYFDGYGFDIDAWELTHANGEPIDHNLTWDDNGVEAGEVIYMETVFDSESSDDDAYQNNENNDDNESGDDTTRFSPPLTSLPPFARLPPVVFILKFEHHRRVRDDGFKAYHQVWNLTMFIHNIVKSDVPFRGIDLPCSHFCLFYGGIPLGDPDQRLPDAFNFATSNTDEIVIEVNLQFEVQFVINSDARRRVRGWFKIDDDVDCLMEYICESEYPNPSLGWGDVRLLHKSNDLKDPYQELHDVFNFTTPDPYALYEIEVNLTIRGGANRPVMKKHLKKEQAVKELCKRSVDIIKRTYGSSDSSEIGELPQVLRPTVQTTLDLMNQVRVKMNSGEDVWTSALNHLDDSQLEAFKAIFDPDVRNKVRTEVKLYQACSSMFPELDKIDLYVEHLKKVKFDCIGLLIEAYALNHSDFGRTGAFEYCNTPYFNSITATINYRNGLRRGAVNAVGDDDENINQENGEQNGCIIM